MQVLRANLKFFYQHRGLWLVYALTAFVFAWVFAFGFWLRSILQDPGHASNTYFARMGLAYVIGLTAGWITGTLQMEVISKPFSFCLPGHRIVCRQLIFFVGLLAILLVALLLFGEAVPSILLRLSICGASLTVYFMGVAVAIIFRRAATAAMIVPTLIYFAFVWRPGAFSQLPVGVCSVVTIILGAGSAVVVWLWLGRASLFRRRCGRPWLGFSGTWSQAEREKYRQAVDAVKTSPVSDRRSGEFLLDAMRDGAPWSAGKHAVGAMYTWLARGGGGRSQIVQIVLLAAVSVVLTRSMDSAGTLFIANVSIWVGLTTRHLPVSSPLLLAGGRRERFFSTMALIAILGGVLILSVTVTLMAIDLFGPFPTMHEFLAGHPDPSGAVMNLRLAVLLTALFPVSRLLEIVLRTRPVAARTTQTMLLLAVAAPSVFIKPERFTVPLACVALGVVLAWLISAYGIYRVALTSDLVSR